jgi:proline iminopeptidase
MKKIILLLLILSTGLLACKQADRSAGTGTDLTSYLTDTASGLKTGGVQVVQISTPKGKFNIWTKKIGNNPKMKLLLLNGGPGATHEYFECMESFMPKEGIEIIYYDQLGCGNSDNPKDTAMWSLPRYVEELEQVRQALKLDNDNFYLLGHSWGGILAAEYAFKYQNHLKGLIISNMMMSCPDYGKYADEVLAKQMDPKVLARIRAIEAKGDFSNPEYMELLEPVNRSLGKLNESLYVTMQGPSEFGIAGKLSKWDRVADLPKLTVPTLSIGGQYDTMDPKHMKMIAEKVPNGSYLYCPKGSHMSLYDDQEVYMAGLIKFIKGVNTGEKKMTL